MKGAHTQCLLAIAFLVPLLSSVFSFSYGPSIYSLTKDESRGNESSHSYKKTSGETLYLSEYAPTFSVLLPLVDGKAFVNESEALNYFKYLHHGLFFIVAPEGWGISAVVQILRLATVFGSSGKCLDYIQFSEEISTENRTSPKICGTIEPQNLKEHSHSARLIGPRSYVTQSSKLTTEIFIFSSTIHSEWTIEESHLDKTITVEISFTAFPLLTALDDGNTDEVPTIPRNTTTSKQKPCSKFESHYSAFNLTGDSFTPCHSEGPWKELFCFHKYLFCDEILNCPSNYTKVPPHGYEEEHNCTESKTSVPLTIAHGDDSEGQDRMKDFNNTMKEQHSRLIPKLANKTQPLKIQIAHWSIIGVGCIIVMIFLIGVLRSLNGNRFCGKNSHDSEVEATESRPETATPSSSETGAQRIRHFELIDRFLNLRRKAMHVGAHAKI